MTEKTEPNQTGSLGVTGKTAPTPETPPQTNEGWQGIESAPRDGRVIWVMHEECGQFPMAWNPTGTNHLFAPGEIGIWQMADRSMTWRDGEDGPSHWKPLSPTPEPRA